MRKVYLVHFVPTVERFGYLKHGSGMMVATSHRDVAERERDDMNRWAERALIDFTEVTIGSVGRFEIAEKVRS